MTRHLGPVVRLFLLFFLIQQGLTLLLEVPLGLIRFVPQLLLVMPILDMISDFAVMCLVATLFNASTSIILALLCTATNSWRPRLGQLLTIGVQGGLIIFYVGDVLFSITAAIVDSYFPIAVHERAILPAAFIGAVIAIAVLRSKDWPLVKTRMRRCGVALCILLLPLMVVPLVRGVRVVFSSEYHSTSIARPIAGGPNILFVVTDTMSAPEMSLYGSTLPTTPKMEAFAQHATVFDNYIATSNFTTPTVASMLSGQQPAVHGVFADSAYFMDGAGYQRDNLLPYVLRRGGYATGAAISNPLAHPLKLHIEDGFDDVLTPKTECDPLVYAGLHFSESSLYKTISLVPYVRHILTATSRLSCRNSRRTNFPPEPTYAKALEWLATGRDKGRPFFLWVHTLPPHGPYLPPPPYLHMFEPSDRYTTQGDYYALGPGFAGSAHLYGDTVEVFRRRYAEDMRYADAKLGDFLAQVGRLGLLKNTIVILTADHGEAFGRWAGHSGPYLDQDLVHVPLIMAGPGIAQGRRVEMTVSQVDLAPTILNLSHLKAPAAMQGRSLVPLLNGDSVPSRPVFSMQSWPGSRFHELVSGTYSVIDGRWKYIQYLDKHEEELFDLESDKADLHNLSAEHPQEVARLRSMVDKYFGPRKLPYHE